MVELLFSRVALQEIRPRPQNLNPRCRLEFENVSSRLARILAQEPKWGNHSAPIMMVMNSKNLIYRSIFFISGRHLECDGKILFISIVSGIRTENLIHPRRQK